MKKILREVLAEDKSLLGRRDELLATLEKKVPSTLRRDFTSIKKAISLNVGEKFLVGEQDKEATKKNVAETLKAAGMQAARIDFVVETFTGALDWDKPKPAESELTKSEPPEPEPPKPKPPKPKPPKPEPPKPEPPKPKLAESEPPKPEPAPPPIPPTNSTPPNNQTTDAGKKVFIGLACVLLLLFFVGGNDNKSNNISAPSSVQTTTASPTASSIAQPTQVAEVEDTSYLDARTDLSLNGMDLGISLAEAQSKLGKPLRIEKVDGYDRHIYSDKFYIAVNDNKVNAFVTHDPKFKTLRGLHVGSTYDEIIDKYGTDSLDMTADNLTLHEYPFTTIDGEYALLRFAVNSSNRVDYISIRIVDPPALGYNWIKDGKGVYIWNPEPQEGESITWTGSYVKDGVYKYADGTGVVTWYNKNGTVVQVDEGTMKHGQRHGQFTHRLKSGNVIQTRYDNGVEIKEEPKSDIDENVKQAARAFKQYHEDITKGNFTAAFNRFTEERKSEMNYNVQAFSKGYADTISSRITDLQLVSSSGNRVVMNYILDARDRAGGGKQLYQQFSGSVEMINVNGEWKIAYTESKRIKEVIER